jgi:hypothetical protein
MFVELLTFRKKSKTHPKNNFLKTFQKNYRGFPLLHSGFISSTSGRGIRLYFTVVGEQFILYWTTTVNETSEPEHNLLDTQQAPARSTKSVKFVHPPKTCSIEAMMSCALRRTTLSGLLIAKDDEDSNYMPSYLLRNKKRPHVDYENCRMKKSRTVNDLSALIMGCHDDVRKVASCNVEEGLKVDNFHFYRQNSSSDVGLEQHFVFLTMAAPLSSSLFKRGGEHQLEEIVEDVSDEDDEEPPSM